MAGFLSVGLYCLIGALIGVIAVAFPRTWDRILSRLADLVLAFPPLVLILATVSLVGPGIGQVIRLLGLLGWPSGLSGRAGQPARSPGVDDGGGGPRPLSIGPHIAKKHLMPSATGESFVAFTFGVGKLILT